MWSVEYHKKCSCILKEISLQHPNTHTHTYALTLGLSVCQYTARVRKLLSFFLTLSALLQKYWSQSSPGSRIQLLPELSSHSYASYHQSPPPWQIHLQNHFSTWGGKTKTWKYERSFLSLPPPPHAHAHPHAHARRHHSAYFCQLKTIWHSSMLNPGKLLCCASLLTKNDIFRLLLQFFGIWQDNVNANM